MSSDPFRRAAAFASVAALLTVGSQGVGGVIQWSDVSRRGGWRVGIQELGGSFLAVTGALLVLVALGVTGGLWDESPRAKRRVQAATMVLGAYVFVVQIALAVAEISTPGLAPRRLLYAIAVQGPLAAAVLSFAAIWLTWATASAGAVAVGRGDNAPAATHE